jgi:hypothetical protein
MRLFFNLSLLHCVPTHILIIPRLAVFYAIMPVTDTFDGHKRHHHIVKVVAEIYETPIRCSLLEDFVMATTKPTAKFSDGELLQIKVLASDRIEVGVWSHLERQISEDYDRVLVLLPIGKVAHYRIERDQTGWTYLLWCSPDTWQLLVCGTLDECLKIFSINTY